ncbi:MAG: A24 family peptidase [Microbacterium sp.]
MIDLLPWWCTVVVLLVLGALTGSFLNLVISRVPQGLGVVGVACACPACGQALTGRDKLPIVSWLALHGARRCCGARIPIRDPLIEAETALAFAVVGAGGYLGWYPAALLPALVSWAAISIALTVIDLDHHRLPNPIVLPSYPLTAVLLVVASVVMGDARRLVIAAIGCLVLFGLYWVLAVASPGGMGFGDVKLAGALGMLLGWLGWEHLVVGTVSAFLLGGAAGIALMATGRATRRSRIPFGPFMLTGAWIGVFAGAVIARSVF